MEFRVGGTPGKTSGASEGVGSIVMSGTGAVKSFFEHVAAPDVRGENVNYGFFITVARGSDPARIGWIEGGLIAPQMFSGKGFLKSIKIKTLTFSRPG